MDEEKKNKGYLFSQREKIKIDPTFIPLMEYPRPQLRRDSYFCLNGLWDIKITKEDKLPESYQEKVMVPYAVESPLSGVNHLLEPDEIIFYHRDVFLPENFVKEKTILHFDGVDQYVEVYINDVMVASHMGGFTPFEVILPQDIQQKFSLTLKVRDWTDESYHTRGKQVLEVTGYFYSSSSGVYKPVWLESVNQDYVEQIIFTPDYDQKKVLVNIKTEKEDSAVLICHGKKYELRTNHEESIELSDDFHPWSPDDPYLYEVEVKYHEDQIFSYFGIRKIEIKEINGWKRILLNDKPIFLSGLLDQGYYFLGNYTPKSYDDYRFDIQKTKEMGFNCLRKHIKTELDTFYYECDKEGILLIQDFPCGGDKYSFFWTVAPRVFPKLFKEKTLTYQRMARESEEGRKEFIREANQYLEMYHNNPSVIIYTIFNEGWGEFDPSQIYHSLKEKEKTKLFDTASGWYDADSDFYSIHTYTIPDMKRIDKRKRPFIISEMGGNSCVIDGHSYFEGFFGHGKAKDCQELTNNYQRLYEEKMKKQIEKFGLNMTIYTELADCETEYNGLFTFDRQVQKIDSSILKKINEELYSELSRCTKEK